MKVKIDFLSPAVNAVSSSNLNGSIEILSPAVSINKSFVLNAEIKSATQAYCELVADAAASMPEVIAAGKNIEALLITDTASGPIASFPDGAEMPLKSLVVDINPVQAGSGDPSPQNIRPISGHTGANVTTAGKNLLPLTVYVGVAYNPTVGATFSTTQHGTQWTDNHDGTFTINTSATWQNYGIFMPVRNGHSYFRQFTFTSTGQGGFSEGYLDGDFKVLSKSNATTMPTTKSAGLVWSTYPTAKYYYVVFTNRGTASATLTLTNPIVSSGTSAVTYEPYNATTKAVTWQDSAGTVYGGTLDVVSGELKARPYYASYAGEALVGPWVSSMDKYVVGATPTTGAQVVDLGGTATEYTLAPEQVVTLLGTNNIWADTGDASVEYVADMKLYINKVVAA